MKTIILFILLFIAFPMHAEASGKYSVGVYPPLTHITTLPGYTIKKDITIINYSNSSVRMKPSFVAFTSSQAKNGAVNYLPDDQAFSAFIKRAHVSLEDEKGIILSEITLAKEEEKKVFLSLTLPKEEKESDYYFSIIFTSQPENQPSGSDSASNVAEAKSDLAEAQVSAVSSIQLEIATNILLSIGNTPVKKAPQFVASTSFFKEKGWVDFSLLATNLNSNVQQAKGVIIIKNMFNQVIGKVDLNPGYILSNTTRLLMDKESGKTSRDTRAIWRENFLLGFYSATISVSFDSLETVKTLYFLAFPFKQAGLILLTLLALKMVWKRVKKNR